MDTRKPNETAERHVNVGAEVDRRLEAFKRLVPHLRGSLWWGRNDEIKNRFPAFNQNDGRVGHPLLSLRKDEVLFRGDGVPMLFGTSGMTMSRHRRQCCIDVVGLTKNDPGHHTYFGSIIEPAVYSVDEMLEGVTPNADERRFVSRDRHVVNNGGERATLGCVPWHELRTMVPNLDKPVVSDDEMKMIDDFCVIHQL